MRSTIPDMTQYLKTIEINAPPTRVWAVLSEVDRWHEWTASITRIDRLDGLPLQEGAHFRVKQPKLPANNWEVTMSEPCAGFTWETRSTGSHIVAEHLISPTANGSRVELRLSFNGWLGKFLGHLGRKLTLAYMDLEAAGLKKAAESLQA